MVLTRGTRWGASFTKLGRHRRVGILIALTLCLTSLLVSSAAPVAAGTPPGGEIILKCAYSHTAQEDPILAPGAQSAHVHDFFGNTGTNASSTYDSLTGMPNNSTGTTCEDTHDTAAYWVPELYFNGAVWHPPGDAVTGYAVRVYYTDFTGKAVVSVPPDLQMINGFPFATGPAPNTAVVSYNCGANNGIKTPISRWPYDCTPYQGLFSGFDGVVARVEFPKCWDGKTVANGGLPAGSHPKFVPPYVSSNSVEDVVQPAPGFPCPSDHPLRIPVISIRLHTKIVDPCMAQTPCSPTDSASAANVKIGFAQNQGGVSAPGPFWTFHADFWNAWNQNGGDAANPVPGTLDDLVLDCLDPSGPNGQKTCGVIRDGHYPTP